jgi:hypothetical protein
MALPKKIKKDINLLTPKPGINPYLGGGDQFIEQNPANLPRGVDFADLDNGFVDWVGKDLNVVVEGELVPVSFLTAQRWSEFTRTWQNSDKYKNIKIPFISVVRNPDVQKGTNPEDFNIPLKDYRIPYMTVPTWDGSKKGADVYLIPQPVKVDVTYTLRFFTYRMSELNVLNQKVLSTFAAAQSYVNIKGHYFPIMLESIGDESTVDDLDGKRYYVQTYELRMMAYILDEEKFEIRPGLERAILSYEVESKRPKVVTKFIKDESQNDKTINLIIQFLVGSPTTVTFVADSLANFVSIDVSNVSNITIYVNNTPVTLPFFLNLDDVVGISIVRNNSAEMSEIILRGTVPL